VQHCTVDISVLLFVELCLAQQVLELRLELQDSRLCTDKPNSSTYLKRLLNCLVVLSGNGVSITLNHFTQCSRTTKCLTLQVLQVVKHSQVLCCSTCFVNCIGCEGFIQVAQRLCFFVHHGKHTSVRKLIVVSLLASSNLKHLLLIEYDLLRLCVFEYSTQRQTLLSSLVCDCPDCWHIQECNSLCWGHAQRHHVNREVGS